MLRRGIATCTGCAIVMAIAGVAAGAGEQAGGAGNGPALSAWTEATGTPAPQLTRNDDGSTRLEWNTSASVDVYARAASGGTLLTPYDGGMFYSAGVQGEGRSAAEAAALARRIFLGAASDQGLPVHRLHVHLEARLAQDHVHFHCCVIDGVFAGGEDGQVHFAEAAALTPEDLAAVQQQVRARVLRWFARAGPLDPADAQDMAGWHHGGGFSLDAAVRIEGADRAGLERLLRYCARPPFALERLEQLAGDQLVYRSPKPQPDGRTELRLSPLELIERLAALIPPPRIHRHRYHGVLAPNAPQRAQVTALARQPAPPLPQAADASPAPARSPARYLWAVLLARIFEILPLRCGLCGGEMIAVGMRIAAHPPHRSQRARLRHWALTLDG